MAVVKAIMITSTPFVLAEAATGIFPLPLVSPPYGHSQELDPLLTWLFSWPGLYRDSPDGEDETIEGKGRRYGAAAVTGGRPPVLRLRLGSSRAALGEK